MVPKNEIKVLGRGRARDLKAAALHKQVDALLAGVKSEREIDVRACFVVLLETCQHLLEKEATTERG